MKRPDWLIVKPKPQTPFQKFQALAKGMMQVPIAEVRNGAQGKGKPMSNKRPKG